MMRLVRRNAGVRSGNRPGRVMIILAAVTAACMVAFSTSCGPVRLKSLAADPKRVEIYADYSKQLYIFAIYSRGARNDVTDNSTYRSSSDNIASVSPSGLVNGNKPGAANVTVTYAEGNTTATVTIPVFIHEFGGTENYSGLS